MLLFGDFNLPISRTSSSYGSPSVSLDDFFMEHFINALDLHQFNSFPTRNSATLDYNISSQVQSIAPSINIFSNDHESSERSLPLLQPPSQWDSSPPNSDRSIRCWKKVDWPAINLALSLLPWDLLEFESQEEVSSGLGGYLLWVSPPKIVGVRHCKIETASRAYESGVPSPGPSGSFSLSGTVPRKAKLKVVVHIMESCQLQCKNLNQMPWWEP